MAMTLPSKLIIVLNSFKAKILEANGLKVTKTLKELDYHKETTHQHFNPPRHQGFTHRSSTQSHFFDPRSSALEIERQEFTKIITKKIQDILTSNPKHYGEVILVAEPKALGELNHSLGNHLKSLVTKQVSKDLVDHEIRDIERAVFS